MQLFPFVRFGLIAFAGAKLQKKDVRAALYASFLSKRCLLYGQNCAACHIFATFAAQKDRKSNHLN